MSVPNVTNGWMPVRVAAASFSPAPGSSLTHTMGTMAPGLLHPRWTDGIETLIGKAAVKDICTVEPL